MDLFIAVTNDDEANIMSAMLAKRMGAKKVMVLIQRRAYVDLVGVASSILRFRLSRPQFPHSSVMSVKPILSASPPCAAALQKRLRQSRTAMSTSRVVGRSIDEIKLPPGTIIGAVVRAMT